VENKAPPLRDIEEEKNAVKRAYLAGYWVGYTGNSEWIGIGRKLKEYVLRAAEEEGLLREAIHAYREGKSLGKALRERELLKGIYTVNHEQEIPAKVHTKKAVFRSSADTGLSRSLPRTSVLDIPRILKRRRLLERPGFLMRKR
jgi:hypothetical protein